VASYKILIKLSAAKEIESAPKKIVSESPITFRAFLRIRGLPVVKNFPATTISIASVRGRIGSSMRSPMWV
jgi:hypothetical protein